MTSPAVLAVPNTFLAHVALVALLALAPKGPTQDPPAATRTPASRTWTAADLARLPSKGVSVVGATEAEADPALTPIQLPSGPAAAPDWTERGKALRSAIELREAQLARIAAATESWSHFALGAPGYQAQASQELRRLGLLEKEVQDRLVQARGDLAMLEERARTEGIAPGALR
jgi:hypothetical protein